MHRTLQTTSITATHLQREVGRVLRRVAKDGAHVTIEHNGFPIAVLVPLSDYAALLQDQRRVNQVMSETTASADHG